MTELALSLLGPIDATLDGRPIERLQSKRALGLLFYLAVESVLGAKSHSREALMELLWPGVVPSSSRVSLRQALYLLRRAVDDHLPSTRGEAVPLLLTDRSTVQLNPAYPLSLDVAEFHKLLEGPQDGWPEAVALYRGDFLADFYLPDANPFELWAAARREAFRRGVLETLDALTRECTEQGRLEEAELYGRRQIEIDNSRESAYRQLMQLYAWQGRRPEALSLYDELAELLDQEFGTVPVKVTTNLVEAIREGPLLTRPGDGRSQAAPELPRIGLQTPIENPYRGLRAFREEDAPFFFGRELFTERLVEEIGPNPLVAVIGPSGSGKSSVIFAGLVPRLREAGGWEVAAFRPGRDPVLALAAALMPLLEPGLSETDRLVETRKMASALGQDLLPLNDVINRIIHKDGRASRLLLVVDQFEELFTSDMSEPEQHHFHDLILSAMEKRQPAPERLLSVVLSLRADFMGQALAYRPLADAFQAGVVMLGPMTSEELAWVVEKPAAKQSVSFEVGLLERILEDVGDEPGNLPLLQFALTALWEHRSNGQLTHLAYDEIGQVQGAVTRQADEIYESLDGSQQEGARRALIQMVRPGRQTADTRRIARRSEIGEDDWHLVRQLADARLVVTGVNPEGIETAELAHEALIRGWDRLSRWMDEDRAFRAWQERLRAALGGWQASEGDEGALLRGSPLSEAENWLSERRSQLSQAEQHFIQLGVELRDHRRIERERVRAAGERLRRRIIAGLSAGLLVVTALALFSLYQGRQAIQATELGQQALSRQLAALSLNFIEDEPDLAYLLSAEAFRRANTFQARNSLLTALTRHLQLIRYLHNEDGAVRAVSFNPDGDLVVTGSSQGTIRLWDPATGRPLGEPVPGHDGIVISLAFHPDRRLLATAGLDDTILFWRISSPDSAANTIIDKEPHGIRLVGVTGLSFNPDGTALVAGDTAGQLHFYDTQERSTSFGRPLVAPISLPIRGISALAFSPDGGSLAVGGSDGSLLLVTFLDNLRNGEASFTIRYLGLERPAHDGNVTSLSFNPDGQNLVSGSFDGTVKAWNLDTLARIGASIIDHEGWVTGLAFTPDGRLLATSGSGGKVLVWDAANVLTGDSDLEPLFTFAGHRDAVHALAMSPDSQALISGGADGKAILWGLSADHPLGSRLGHGEPTYAATFATNSPILFSTAGEGRDSVVLWDMDERSPTFGQPLGRIPTGHGPIEILAANQDDSIVAAGDDFGTISVWDIEQGVAIRAPFRAHENAIIGLAFGPDRVLVSGSGDRSFMLLDLHQSESPAIYSIDEFGPDRVRSLQDVALSPDGETLVITTDDRRILRYDVQTLLRGSDPGAGAILSPYESPQSRIVKLEFSLDGRFIGFSTLQSVFLWSADTGSPIWATGHNPSRGAPGVGALVFSRDSQTLAYGSYNGTDLIDVASGNRYDSGLINSALIIETLSYGPEDHLLAASTSDKRTTLWDVDPESWRQRACRRVNRNLTLDEWHRFFGDEPYHKTCPDTG